MNKLIVNDPAVMIEFNGKKVVLFMDTAQDSLVLNAACYSADLVFKLDERGRCRLMKDKSGTQYERR